MMFPTYLSLYVISNNFPLLRLYLICRFDFRILHLRCVFVFLQIVIAGVSHELTKALATMLNNVATYSAGIGGGNAIKVAVKFPNLLILKLACTISGFICKKSKIESTMDDGGTRLIN